MSDAAEACRELARGARSAALATIAAGNGIDGAPYASFVLVAWDARYRPILLLSSLAEHTRNLEASDHASLLLTGAPSDQPLDAPRMTVVGRCAPLAGDAAA